MVLFCVLYHVFRYMSIRKTKNNYDFYQEITKNVLTNYEFRGIIYIVNGARPHTKKGKKHMSRNELITTIEQLKEWEAILEEAQAEAEALRDSLKQQMLEEDTEELSVGAYIIRWTSVLSNRFDSTAFKKEHGELYKSFTKQVASKRFTIA